MKIIFTITFFFFLFSNVHAQSLLKGSSLLGGTVGFGSGSRTPEAGETKKQNNTSLNPSAGWFYRNNRVVGINIYYGRSKNELNGYKQRNFGAGVFLRQYIPLGRSFNLFGEENLSFNRYRSDYLEPQQYLFSKYSTVSLGFFPGLAYSITSHFQAEVSLPQLLAVSYSKGKARDQSGSPAYTTKDFGLSAGASNGNAIGYLSFGLKWLIPRK